MRILNKKGSTAILSVVLMVGFLIGYQTSKKTHIINTIEASTTTDLATRRKNFILGVMKDMCKSSLQEQFQYLKSGVTDKKSIDILNYAYACTLNGVLATNESIKLPDFQLEYKKMWEKSYSHLQKQYKGILTRCEPEVLFFNHGLKFANQKVLNYIKNRDIVDCGAYDGDSAVILSPYTDKKIYSFELSPKNIELFRKTLEACKLIAKVTLIEQGLSDKSSVEYINDTCCYGTSLNESGDIKVNITTLDEALFNKDIQVGFLKADLEGYGLKALQGGIKLIKRDRPVIAVSMYHNADEFFKIKPFLMKELKDYVYELNLEQFEPDSFLELSLFCYPKEITDSICFFSST